MCPFIDHTQCSHYYWHGRSSVIIFIIIIIIIIGLIVEVFERIYMCLYMWVGSYVLKEMWNRSVVISKVLDSGLKVSKFELKSCYYDHFWTDTLGNIMQLFLLAMC